MALLLFLRGCRLRCLLPLRLERLGLGAGLAENDVDDDEAGISGESSARGICGRLDFAAALDGAFPLKGGRCGLAGNFLGCLGGESYGAKGLSTNRVFEGLEGVTALNGCPFFGVR